MASSEDMRLPAWFIKFIAGVSGGFIALFVPWAAWLTFTTITMNAKIDVVGEVTDSIAKIHDRLSAEERETYGIKLELIEMRRRIEAAERPKP